MRIPHSFFFRNAKRLVVCGLAAALVFAVLAWLLFLFRDSGKSDGVFSAMLVSRLPQDNISLQTVIPVMLLLGRMVLLVVLYVRGQMWHLPMVIGAMFTLEAILTMDGDFIPLAEEFELMLKEDMYIKQS